MPTLKQQLDIDQTSTELQSVIFSICHACTIIEDKVSQGALAHILGATDMTNIQGENQKKLDVIANDILKETLTQNEQVKTLASEEEDTAVACHEKGHYVVAFDPLDGSSNIDVNGSIGTIFTVLPAIHSLPSNSPAQFYQKGTQQVAAGYVIYGPSCMLVLTTKKQTHVYTYHKEEGVFQLTQHALTLPKATSEYAINAANQRFWHPETQRYISDLIAGESGIRKKRFNMRWSGAMVGDMHRVLMRGGIFLYPADMRNPDNPFRLRLLYEALPMAMLAEHAGGAAYAETQQLLHTKVESLHQRTAVLIGSEHEIQHCISYYK